MEAQHTVGYGIKAPTDECAEAIFVNTVHCIIGFVMQVVLVFWLCSRLYINVVGRGLWQL